MDISLVAKMKKYDEFISCYNEGDEKKLYKGKSLLFYSLSNNDAESRYLITDFLLNKGAETNVINECGENLLHILLSRTNHNIKQTAELCQRLIKNGVDINFYDVNKTFEKNSWRKAHNMKETDFLLFFGGILGYAQDIEVILKTAKLVSDNKDIKFIIYGTGPEKERLVAMKNQLELENVFFFDAVPKSQMQNIIMDMNCSMAPLKKIDLFKGAIPTKIFENLALKKPLLLGVEGEAKDLFVDKGKCCLFFEPENPEEMKKQVLYLYNNPDKLQELGENGLDYVSKYFNRDIIAEEYYQALTKIL